MKRTQSCPAPSRTRIRRRRERRPAPAQPEPEVVVSAAIDLRPTRYRSTPERPADSSPEREREHPMSHGRMTGDIRRRRSVVPSARMRSRRPLRPRPGVRRTCSRPPRAAAPPAPRRQGYRPDDASGVREIYRGPAAESTRESATRPARQPAPGFRAATLRSVPPRPKRCSRMQGTPARSAELNHRRTMWAGSAPDEASDLARGARDRPSTTAGHIRP